MAKIKKFWMTKVYPSDPVIIFKIRFNKRTDNKENKKSNTIINVENPLKYALYSAALPGLGEYKLSKDTQDRKYSWQKRQSRH